VLFLLELFAIALGMGCSTPSQPLPPEREMASVPVAGVLYPHLSDAHFHFVDFLQRTDGMDAALRAMDKAGIDEIMISGMPVVKKWSKDDARQPLYYLEDDSSVYWYSATDVLVARAVLAAPVAERHRFHPFITGFNGSDRNALDHVKRMMEWYPDFWEGIGEVMAHHDDLSALTPGETTRPDGIALDPVFDYAAAHDLPVSIHTNIGSVWLREPIYLPEVEHMLTKHPKTRFIWCHAGISRRIVIPNLVAVLERVLRKHQNLWIDLSWVVFENYVAPGGKVDLSWVDLIKKYPSRFMIGTDVVGHFEKYVPEVQKYYVLLKELPPEIALRVGRTNFLDILPQRINKLSQR
jgi:predicted TIM-barrel fold metal-dependent hydrolase